MGASRDQPEHQCKEIYADLPAQIEPTGAFRCPNASLMFVCHSPLGIIAQNVCGARPCPQPRNKFDLIVPCVPFFKDYAGTQYASSGLDETTVGV